ncbi:LacI family DNA-binding transcriptional regulator [Deinococcus roseus]|uniref:LacI family transcriptional regulator n=1 Tax=Deinococcus roseus TaxID=392414 RepID=A0ABQ2CZ94_9DEIO|nr:LacI family DNA-binding transcriptional regulator [Deinococcus roseus]GGJ35660.1 LacI family transcriptional regulator [Deinococcus roseus]
MSKPTLTLEDIAQLTGVSAMTVSRVLSGKSGVSEATRRKVLETVQNVGYVPNLNARALAGSRTRVLGMLVPDFSTQYISELARGAGEAAIQAGYELVCYTNSHHPQANFTHVTLITRGLVDGLIVVLPDLSDQQLDALSRINLKLVIVDHRHEVPDVPSIDADNYRGARLMMDHLLSLGHTRIGFISGRPDTRASLERLRGYRESLQLHGLPIDETLIRPGNFLQPEGFTQTQHLLSLLQPPTAIFAANDLMAFGAMDAIRGRGLRIPEDLSVAGFDDIPMSAHLHPGLTTVHQPLSEMGSAATRMLVNLLSGTDIPGPRLELRTELRVRQSTGKAPRGQQTTP